MKSKEPCIRCGIAGQYPSCERCQLRLEEMGEAIKWVRQTRGVAGGLAAFAYVVNNLGFKYVCELLGMSNDPGGVEHMFLVTGFDEHPELVKVMAVEAARIRTETARANNYWEGWDDED